MVKLKVTMANGDIGEYKVTPAVEYGFEQYSGRSFFKAMTEDRKQTDLYWIAWKCMFLAGVEVKPFGEKFLEMLTGVEVLDDTPLE